MNDEAILATARGLEIAFVHLGHILEQRGVIARSELAATFESTAINLPPDLQGREQVVIVLRDIAAGLRVSGSVEPLKPVG